MAALISSQSLLGGQSALACCSRLRRVRVLFESADLTLSPFPRSMSACGCLEQLFLRKILWRSFCTYGAGKPHANLTRDGLRGMQEVSDSRPWFKSSLTISLQLWRGS